MFCRYKSIDALNYYNKITVIPIATFNGHSKILLDSNFYYSEFRNKIDCEAIVNLQSPTTYNLFVLCCQIYPYLFYITYKPKAKTITLLHCMFRTFTLYATSQEYRYVNLKECKLYKFSSCQKSTFLAKYFI